MNKDQNIKANLESLKSQNKYDNEFIDLLIHSHNKGEDPKTTAKNISNLIDKRYAKAKENKT